MKRLCKNCAKELVGRSDKIYCDAYCKSAYQYEDNKRNARLYREIDRQLKINRKILKAHNRKGLATIRKQELIGEGFNPKYFTHYWKNPQGQVYLFCYEFGFLSLDGAKSNRYLLVQHQDYMN